MDEAKKTVGKQALSESDVVHGSSDVIEPIHDLADEALGFVEKHEGFIFTPEQDKAVLRKIDRHIMPLVIVTQLDPGFQELTPATDVHLIPVSIHGQECYGTEFDLWVTG
jgi:precorrin-6B methylase 1